MCSQENINALRNGNTYLGIELGSTRIKAVLIDKAHNQIASGSHNWENHLENGIWTYTLDGIWNGLRDCYAKLSDDVLKKYNTKLVSTRAMGISAMMHGYLAVGKDNRLLTPFRTWRNTYTEEASRQLTELFEFNVPQRWSAAHLYQSILNGEEHVSEISYLTTLAGYIHWQLTGEKVLGIGDASGMFPINDKTRQFDSKMQKKFDELVADKKFPWKLSDIMPKVLLAGEGAGILTVEGAKLLDPTGTLKAGIPLCPPEGDAGTGMVATNCVGERTGNVSVGTSVFAMIVLEKSLKRVYPEIDMVTTPTGNPVAMVHCNNCTSDLDAWVNIFHEFSNFLGLEIEQSKLFELLFQLALKGDSDCGGLLSYNYLSGEPITHFEEGRPLFVRTPDSHFTLANFMRVHLFSAFATLKIGLDILFEQEHVMVNHILGHGGLFKTNEVGQRMMAASMNVPVSVMETAGEGGAWGIALLASYLVNKSEDESLESFLTGKVFAGENCVTIDPDQADVTGFNAFMERYRLGLEIEKTAVSKLR